MKSRDRNGRREVVGGASFQPGQQEAETMLKSKTNLKLKANNVYIETIFKLKDANTLNIEVWNIYAIILALIKEIWTS